jgi:hypothetical protein
MTIQQLTHSNAVIGRVFAELAAQWRKETLHLSDTDKIVAHPMYRALIALGERVVPFMLKELEGENPEHWFAALHEITGENPVKPEERGRMKEMAAAWLAWGRQHGHPTGT